MPSTALSASVLVLNRFYMAVHVVNVRRALGLLFRELAEVIHFEEGQYANYNFDSWREISAMRAAFKGQHEDWIRGVNFELQVPRVIRLLSFDRVPKQTIRFNRRNLFARDGNRCQYCGKSFPTSELSLDHVVPKSRNGTTCWENIVCSCVSCNVKKGGRTPQEAHMICSALADDFELARPGGAFYVFPKCPWGTGDQFVHKAIENKLLIIPGRIFSERDTHFRISYAASDATIERGLEVLKKLARMR